MIPNFIISLRVSFYFIIQDHVIFMYLFLSFVLNIFVKVGIFKYFSNFVSRELFFPNWVWMRNPVLFLGRWIESMICVLSLFSKSCQFDFFKDFSLYFLCSIADLLINFTVTINSRFLRFIIDYFFIIYFLKNQNFTRLKINWYYLIIMELDYKLMIKVPLFDYYQLFMISSFYGNITFIHFFLHQLQLYFIVVVGSGYLEVTQIF